MNHQIGRSRERARARGLDFVGVRTGDEKARRRQVEGVEIKALRRPARRDLERIDGASRRALELAAGERVVSGGNPGTVGRQGACVGGCGTHTCAQTGPLERRGGALA